MTEPRYCGGCTLCCLVLDIPELNKKAGQKCKHSISDGCSIYSERPQVCRDFHCAWSFRLFKDKKGKLRPDVLGVVAVPRDEILGYKPACQLVATEKKILKKLEVRLLAKSLAKNGFYVALSAADSNTSEFMLPNGVVRTGMVGL